MILTNLIAVLVGLVARGKSCAMRNYPGIYTRYKATRFNEINSVICLKLSILNLGDSLESKVT